MNLGKLGTRRSFRAPAFSRFSSALRRLPRMPQDSTGPIP